MADYDDAAIFKSSSDILEIRFEFWSYMFLYIFHRRESVSLVFSRFLREAPRASRFTDVRIIFTVLFRRATSSNKVDGISQVRPFQPRDKSLHFGSTMSKK